MKVVRNLRDHDPAADRPVATIGNFDGIHLGHQRLLARLQTAAQERGTSSMVITFEPHPVKVLAPQRDFPLIQPYAEKLQLMERLGVDTAVVIRFTTGFAATDAETFLREVVADQLRVSHVLVGPDTRFGRDRGGDPEQLRRLGHELGFTQESIPPVREDGRIVSSTAVRALVREGDVGSAGRLLGRFHRLRGVVVRGHRRGRKLGFPTANIQTTDDLLPADGVYVGRMWRDYSSYDSVVNVGVKPTFGDRHRTVEAHVLDFADDLYGEQVTLDLIERVRGERRFRNGKELARQIQDDVEQARRLLRAAR